MALEEVWLQRVGDDIGPVLGIPDDERIHLEEGAPPAAQVDLIQQIAPDNTPQHPRLPASAVLFDAAHMLASHPAFGDSIRDSLHTADPTLVPVGWSVLAKYYESFMATRGDQQEATPRQAAAALMIGSLAAGHTVEAVVPKLAPSGVTNKDQVAGLWAELAGDLAGLRKSGI